MSFESTLQSVGHSVNQMITFLTDNLNPRHLLGDASNLSRKEIVTDIFKKIFIGSGIAGVACLGGAGLFFGMVGGAYLQGAVVSLISFGLLTTWPAFLIGTVAPFLLTAATAFAIAGGIALGCCAMSGGVVAALNFTS